MAQLKITLVKSPIGYTRDQQQTLRSLKLTKLQQSVVMNDTPSIRGMVNAVGHLVVTEEVSE